MNDTNTLAQSPASQPSGVRDLVSSTTGKVRGTQYLFACNQTTLELKATLKEQGFKGRALSNKISEIRRGDSSLAQAQALCFVTAMTEAGFIATRGERLANSGVMRFERIKEEKESKASVNKALEQHAKKLMANMGCSMEEALAYLA